MLVLKRRAGESIVINEQLRIVVVNTSNGACKLAFDAPPSDRIRRGELPAFEDVLPFEKPVVSSLPVARRVPK